MAAVLDGLAARGLPPSAVSGSDGAELREVFAEQELVCRFRSIHGSPRRRRGALRGIPQESSSPLPLGDLRFLGDAKADLKAAEEVGARFACVDHFPAAKPRMRALAAERGFPMVRDLHGLPALLDA